MKTEQILESIDVTALSKVCGGTTPQQDLTNMLSGAAQGALRGGPVGAIVGTVKGAVPGFVDAGRDYFNARRQGQSLDAQREAMRQKHPEYFTTGPKP
ncbi:MAG TPA: Blp family class II bacteriocin [Kofleriaceae bacterium]|nr:Blp family class II bacteriocin [Kofleriaceae bacterium]